MKKIFILIITLFPLVAFATDYELEYKNSANFLDIINANVAYGLGYTGAGVTVGVFDESVKADHPELDGKTSIMPVYSLDNGSIYVPNFMNETHGTHVAGIIAANKDGVGMHGVAYNSSLVGMAVLPDNSVQFPVALDIDFEGFFKQYPDVRIVNNSWGGTFFSYIPYEVTTVNGIEIAKYWQQNTPTPILSTDAYINADNFFASLFLYPDITTDIGKYLISTPDKVFVWAAGNEGMLAPTFESLMPRYFGSELNNLISVGSLNSKQITRDESGTLTVKAGGFANYSNQSSGAERLTVFAPGTNILSADASDDDYVRKNGTSMAAPVVSGALALVQEKYPWMTGKQLADTVISTANSDFTAPEYIVQYVQPDRETLYFVITYIDKAAPTLTTDQVKELITTYYNEVYTYNEEVYEQNMELIEDGYYTIVGDVTKEQVFGQGILDVGKAINGFAELDANRMTANNVITIAELGNAKYAMETLNTSGHNAELSNDITEFKWDDKYHFQDYKTTANGGDTQHNSAAMALDGTSIGIIKQGAGRLVLSGNNSYGGATIVEGGELAIATRTDGTGGTLANSSVVVRSGGTLSGNGNIANSLLNDGTVAPGLFGYANGDTLNVGYYTQSADATLRIDLSGNNNGKLNVTTGGTIDGNLVFNAIKGYYASGTQNYSIFTGVIPTGAFSSLSITTSSPTLMFSASQDNTTYSITSTRQANAYSKYAQNNRDSNIAIALETVANTASGDMQTLISTLDFSNPNGQDISNSLVQLSAESYDIATQLALTQQNAYNNFFMFREHNSEQNNVNVWAEVLTSRAFQDMYQSVSGYIANSVGAIAGVDYKNNPNLSTGIHVAFSNREVAGFDNYDANINSQNFSLGIHSRYDFDILDGLYSIAQARFGVEMSEMERTVNIIDYKSVNNSTWTDFVGSAFVGGGKNWGTDTFRFGPLIGLEYTFLNRPDVKENDNMATNLAIQNASYESLNVVVGAQVDYSDSITEILSFRLSMLGTWKHELFDGNISSTSAFVGYENSSFESETLRLSGDVFALQTSIRFIHDVAYALQFDIGGEMSDTDGEAFQVGVKFAYSF